MAIIEIKKLPNEYKVSIYGCNPDEELGRYTDGHGYHDDINSIRWDYTTLKDGRRRVMLRFERYITPYLPILKNRDDMEPNYTFLERRERNVDELILLIQPQLNGHIHGVVLKEGF